jgi:TonB family protein
MRLEKKIMVKRSEIPLIIRHSVGGRFVRAYQFHRARTLIIGSGQKSDIRLLSSDVSGIACTVELSAGKSSWIISDLGSQPDLKIRGKPFVEHKLLDKATLVIGQHTLELEPVTKRREMFSQQRTISGSTQEMTVVKWRGHVIDTCFGESQLKHDALNDLEVFKVSVPVTPLLQRDKVKLEPEMKRSIISTLALGLIFFAVLLGIPTPQETAKPKDNVYTKMIFDSKILSEKKKQLTTFAHKTTGTGVGNGSISEGAKGQQTAATHAVASMRKAGLQSLISKIAGRASQSAKLIARLSAMPSANASIGGSELNGSAMPTVGAVAVKAALGGNGKGYKISGIGTSGKGGGSGDYKDGSALGTGNVGNGEVALEDAESVVEGGLDRDVIAAIIKEHLGQIRYCYERQLAADADLYGKIKVKFNIGADGSVETQSIGQSTLKSAMVEECILRRIATWKFPKPKGGTKVMVSYPFLFKSVN